MRLLLLINTALLFPFLGISNNSDTTIISLVPSWEKDDSQSFSIQNHTWGIDRENKKMETFISYNVRMKIIEKSDTGYLISWLFEKTLRSDTINSILYLAKEGLEIIYRTDKKGTFKEVINAKSIYDYLKMRMNKLDKNHQFDYVLQQYSSKEGIQQNAIEDIKLYHKIYGEELKQSGKTEKLCYMDIPIENKTSAVPAKYNAITEALDFKKKYYKTSTVTEPDMKTILEQSKMEEDPNSKSNEEMEAMLLGLIVKDKSDYEIDLIKGWVILLHYSQELKILDGEISFTEFDIKINK